MVLKFAATLSTLQDFIDSLLDILCYVVTFLNSVYYLHILWINL